MLTNSKGIILIHLKKRGRKSGLPSTWQALTLLVDPVPQCSPIARIWVRSIIINNVHFSICLLCLMNIIYTSNMCSWYPPVQKTKRLTIFSNPDFWKKDGPSPMKSVTFYWTWTVS
jgi:hypothetical protein